MAYHVLRDIYGNMLASVMDSNGVSYEFGEDGGSSVPSFENALLACFVHSNDSFIKCLLYIRALLYTPTQFKCLLSALLAVAALNDELIRTLVLSSGLVSKSRLAPRSYRAGSTDGGFTLTTTVGVIAGVHNRTSYCGSPTHVALSTSFTDAYVFVLDVTNLSNSCHSFNRNISELSGRQTDKCISTLFCHELSHDAGASCKLSALTRIKLDVVDKGTNGDIA